MSAVDIIKKFEGCKLTAYLCPAGVLTIGYGHTREVQEGQVITVELAERLLKDDIGEAEEDIRKVLKVTLNVNQMAAIVSFVFNFGLTKFASSTLLRRLNEGRLSEASMEFLKWNKSCGKVLPGLTKRRQAEKALFLTKVA